MHLKDHGQFVDLYFILCGKSELCQVATKTPFRSKPWTVVQNLSNIIHCDRLKMGSKVWESSVIQAPTAEVLLFPSSQ